MPKISIIVPVYKAEAFLASCVESICNQSFSDLEIILVDDGSPDSCPVLCDKYAEQDSRIKVIHKANGGVSTARNAGLDAASGDYITFVDSDDYIDSCMYEKMISIAVAHSCDMVMCDCLKEFEDHSELYTHDIRGGFYDRQQLEHEYFPHLIMMENVEYPPTISNCLLLFHKDLAESIRYLPGVRYSEDLLFGAQLMYAAHAFYYLKDKAYYHYRINEQSATHRFVPDKWTDYQRLYQGIQASFGNSTTYDFSRQIDLSLLFFLYNSLGDILRTQQLCRRDKKHRILEILDSNEVRTLFSHLDISSLPISTKQKLITHLYAQKLLIGVLIRYYEH